MHYYKQTNTNVEKYQVTINKQELQALKDEIINNCSKIIHYDYIGNRFPNFLDKQKIRNYHSSITEETKNHITTASYHITYDHYNYPYIVCLINRLMDYDMSAIDEILNPCMEKEQNDFRYELQELKKELVNSKAWDVNDREELYEKIRNLLQQIKLNKDRKPVYGYYDTLKDLLKLNFVEAIPIKNIKDIETFYEEDNLFDIKKINCHARQKIYQ